MKLSRRIDKKLRRRSFEYLKWRSNREFKGRIDEEKMFLLVYQMGKVGSSTLTQYLRAHYTQAEIFQIHTLTESGAQRIENRYRQAAAIRSIPSIDQHILESRYLMSRLKDLKSGKQRAPLKVVSMVRDPIARNLSAFFQTFEVDFARMFVESNQDATMSPFSIEELTQAFLTGSQTFRHEYPLVWFQEELHQALDIDVLSKPFDPELGVARYQNNYCDLLILRMEDFPHTLAPSLSRFLNIEVGPMPRSNSADGKKYSNAYRNFIDHITLPESYLDTMYNSAFSTHFYTEEELDRFRARWTR